MPVRIVRSSASFQKSFVNILLHSVVINNRQTSFIGVIAVVRLRVLIINATSDSAFRNRDSPVTHTVDERVLHVLLNVEHGNTVSSLSFRVTCSVENHTTILDRAVRGTDRNLLSSRLKPNVLRVSTGFKLQHRIVLLDISLLNWGRRCTSATARQITLNTSTVTCHVTREPVWVNLPTLRLTHFLVAFNTGHGNAVRLAQSGAQTRVRLNLHIGPRLPRACILSLDTDRVVVPIYGRFVHLSCVP